MKIITREFTVENSWDGVYAQGIFAVPQGNKNRYTNEPPYWWAYTFNVIPEISANRNITLNIKEIPNGAVFQSVSITRTITVDSFTSFTTTWLTTPDISGSSDINQRVLNYLQQNPGTQSIVFAVHNAFVEQSFTTTAQGTEDTCESLDWQIGRRQSRLKSARITMEVTYQISDDSTVSYGTNNTWQKCNVYYGTGGSWQKCKAYFGTGGSWQEVK